MNKLFLTSSVSFVAESIGKKLDAKAKKSKLVLITTPVEEHSRILCYMFHDPCSMI